MREQETGRQKELDSLIRGYSWDRLSAIHWRNQLAPISYLYYDDGSSGSRQTFLTRKEFARHLAIIVISTGAFGTGLGQLITEFIGR